MAGKEGEESHGALRQENKVTMLESGEVLDRDLWPLRVGTSC